jgi:hypothetical protein
MPETHSSTASFSEFGAKPMSDQQFVKAIDATMAPGLKLMNTTCLTASHDRKEVVVSFELDDRFINVAG